MDRRLKLKLPQKYKVQNLSKARTLHNFILLKSIKANSKSAHLTNSCSSMKLQPSWTLLLIWCVKSQKRSVLTLAAQLWNTVMRLLRRKVSKSNITLASYKDYIQNFTWNQRKFTLKLTLQQICDLAAKVNLIYDHLDNQRQ